MIHKLPLKPCAAVLIFLIALGVPACGKNGGNGGVDTLLEQGTGYLAEGDYDSAIVTYEEILAAHDSDNPQARWGIVVGTLMNAAIDTVGLLATFQDAVDPDWLASSIAGVRPQNNGCPPYGCDGKDYCYYLDNLISEVLPHLDALKEYADFSMCIEACTIGAQLDPETAFTIRVGGEFDLGEVYFLSGVLRSLQGVALVCQAADTGVLGDPGMQTHVITDPAELDRDFLFDLYADFLADAPDFLTLDTEHDGAGLLARAADLLTESMDDLFESIKVILAEEDDQSDDIIVLEVEGGVEYFSVRIRENDRESNPRTERNPELGSALERIRDGFAADGGVRISWGRDLVPILAAVISTFTKTAIFDYLFERFLGIDMGPVFIPSDFSEVLFAIIPDVVEFDFGKFLRDPSDAYLRSIAPVNMSDDGGDPFLLVEYECGETLGRRQLICPFPEAITSTGHFVGTDYAIPDDGRKRRVPYVAVSDPSLGGFVYLNLHSLDQEEFEDEYKIPGLYEFNYLHTRVLGIITAFIVEQSD